jgi:hypothetical protein
MAGKRELVRAGASLFRVACFWLGCLGLAKVLPMRMSRPRQPSFG